MPLQDWLVSRQGVRVPPILYGTAWKGERTEELVRKATAAGFRGIDTACQPKHYHEPGVGAALAACQRDGIARSELYIQTKFTPLAGHDPERIPYDPAATLAEQVAQSCAASLRNLQVDYLDALVLHSPLGEPRDMREVWEAMQRAFDAGTVRQLGISNCPSRRRLAELYQWARIKPSIVQNRFYSDTDYDTGVRAFCRDQEIIYEGFWTLTANREVLAHDTTVGIAARYERSTAQVLYRYLTQVGIVPLTGTTSEAHMREDLSIFGFSLSQAELEAMTTLLG